jgi:nondiscriminating glutamyl-tRNA synthetase
MNQQYIQNLNLEDFHQRLLPFLAETTYAGEDEILLRKAIKILQPRLVTLSEIGGRLSLFFDNNPVATDPEVKKLLRKDTSKNVLSIFIKQLESIDKLTEENFASVVGNIQQETMIKGKDLWLPLRYAITLEAQGPDLKLMVDFFGKEKCLQLARQAQEL